MTRALAAVVAAAALTVTATPAQAATAVRGKIYNVSKISPAWIMLSSTYPATTTYKIYPGHGTGAKAFVSGWNCYSPWGYRYSAGVWRAMTTTNPLALDCRAS